MGCAAAGSPPGFRPRCESTINSRKHRRGRAELHPTDGATLRKLLGAGKILSAMLELVVAGEAPLREPERPKVGSSEGSFRCRPEQRKRSGEGAAGRSSPARCENGSPWNKIDARTQGSDGGSQRQNALSIEP